MTPRGRLAFDAAQTGHLKKEMGRRYVDADLPSRQSRGLCSYVFEGWKKHAFWLTVGMGGTHWELEGNGMTSSREQVY